MPNWINNELIITGEVSRVRELFDTVVTTSTENRQDFDFNKIIPMPAHQPDVNSPNPFWAGDSVGAAERLVFKENNWYDWSTKHWGTKWNADETWSSPPASNIMSGEASGKIEFNTAWATVEDLMAKLSLQYPDLLFEYSYTDEGLEFGGRMTLKAGTMTDNEDLSEEDILLQNYEDEPDYYEAHAADYLDYENLFKAAGHEVMYQLIQDAKKK